MIPTRQVDRETHIADILIKSEAALGELHQYYKFGRHEGTFPEKPYLLLSHCAHLLFSLWLTESESPTGLFEYSSHLNALISNLDFGALRYTDYKRRALHADAYQEHLKNEPKWFKFWLTALEKQDGTRPLDCQEFTQSILTYVSHPCFLEGKIPKKNRKLLAGLMKTDAVAQIFCRSMSVLEEMIAAIVFRFTNLDQSNHTSEQLASLMCLLRQVRRTIVSETPAQGPYVLLSNKNWGIPSTLFRMYGDRMRGNLKVVPKRDGGHIVCSYSWTSSAQSKCRSWTRATSAMTAPYEEELFKTWSYETGERLHTPEPSTDPKAYWLVQSTEAKRLRAVFRHIETVLKTLAVNPLCSGLIADIARVSMDNQSDWQGTRLAWTYVKKLDHLLDKLNFAYREASVLGGQNPGEEVIATMWPPESPVSEGVESLRAREHDAEQLLGQPPSTRAATQAKPVESTNETPVNDQRPQKNGVEKEQNTSHEPTALTPCSDSNLTTTHRQVSFSPSEASLPTEPADGTQQPDEVLISTEENECCGEEIAEDSISKTVEGNETQQTAGDSLDQELDAKRRPQEDTHPTGPPPPKASRLVLKQELLERHTPVEGSVNWEPLSRKQLQQQLGWKQSEVQRAMTTIFGPQPFTVYKQRCQEKTIYDFLRNASTARREPQTRKAAESDPETVIARMVSDRMFCQCIAQQPRSDADALQEPADTEPTTNASPPVSDSSEQISNHDYQAYFKRLANQGVAASVRPAANSRYRQTASHSRTARPKIKPEQMEACRRLLHRLVEHHDTHAGLPGEEPLSLRTLQQDLGWKQSEVQCAMASIFGRRPFTVYKHKCSERVIDDFLEDCRHRSLDGVDSQQETGPRQTLQTV